MKINTTSTNFNSHRLHGIDFARAILMTLGLTYHTGLIYGDNFSWRVTSNETVWYLGELSTFISLFRMESFYLISGFFYFLIYSKQRDGFLADRVIRAAIPLFFCGLLINPLMNMLSVNRDIPWDLNYLVKGYWLGHLWFLGNLIVYFLISNYICKYIEKIQLNKMAMLLVFFVIVPILSIVSVTITNHSYNGTILFINFSGLLYYFTYFILGALCFINKKTFLSLLDKSSLLLSLALIIFLVCSKLIVVELGVNDNLIKVINYLIVGPTVLSALSILINIGKRDSPMIRRFSDSSYSVYLLHQPLIILFYVLIFDHVDLGAVTEYLLLVFIVFFTSYFLHIKIISKSDYLLFAFNGMRKQK